MKVQKELVRQAKALTKQARLEIIIDFAEIELHHHLKELFQSMDTEFIVEITHGRDEYGKDIVIVKKETLSTIVYGVIVKKGAKGRTSGDVDELNSRLKKVIKSREKALTKQVESQVRQALKHPVESKAFFHRLPVTNVIIVLAGNISNNARQRIEREIEPQMKGNLKIYDLNWLIDNFTEHYPQVYYQADIIDYLQENIEILEKKHWLSRKNINLSEYFVEPLVSPINVAEIDKDDWTVKTKKTRIPFLKFKDLLTKKKKIILIGDPGTGKTGALSELAIQMLKNAYNKLLKGQSKEIEIEIPIFLTAEKFLNFSTTDDLLKKYTRKIEKFKTTVLIIDALDEVKPDIRKKVLKNAMDFSKKLSCSVIISSRKIDIIKNLIPDFTHYELLPFEFHQALKLFQKLAVGDQELNELKDALDKIKYQIPIIPLSLMLLLTFVEEKKEIPASVTELYDRFFDLVLGREDRSKGIEVLFAYFVKKRFLSSLAYKEYMLKNKFEIDRKTFLNFIDSYSKEYGWDKDKMKDFLKEIERAGILDIGDAVVFRHRSFLDYFAAFYIFDNQEDFKDLNEVLVSYYFDDIWREVPFFYIGLKRKINKKILKKIFDESEDNISNNISKLLIGRLLQAGWDSPSNVKYYGIEQSLKYAPTLREQLCKYFKSNKLDYPPLISDIIVMAISDLSFNSGFLFKEAKKILDDYSNQEIDGSIYASVPLLWAINRFLDENERKKAINNILGSLANLNSIDQARVLLLLMFIEREDKEIIKSLKRRIKRIKKRSPGLLKGL